MRVGTNSDGLPGRPAATVAVVARGILLAAVALALLVLLPAGPALALKPIVVPHDEERLELTTLGEFYEGRGDSLQVETAPDASGATGRISVKATTPGTDPGWIVFALSNPSDKPIERWLTADRYSLVGSGVVWPDLDAGRIEAVTPSLGFVPERLPSDRADVFRITLEPGQTITFVAELASDRFARIYLWKPIDYEIKVRDRQLFNGIMLGLTGLLAIFLTSIFAANHKIIFPAAALVAWCVLGYLCVDFGYFHKLFNLRPEDNAVYRAAAESAIAASLVMFLYAFLRIGLGHGIIRMLVWVWMLAQLALVAVAVIDPRLAATFARASFVAIGGIGGLFALYLAVRGQDRALFLLPPWILFLVWIFGAGVTLAGRLSGEIVVSGLVAGLVLIIITLGFVVTQFAFTSLGSRHGTMPSEQQLRSLAVDGAGAAVWEWNGRRDEIKVSPVVEQALGLSLGELSNKVEEFIKHVHTADRERFKLMLWSVQERAGGKIRVDFRMRHADNSYRWFELEAASVETNDRRSVRCVGLMRDVTDAKRAHERLLHDAVHDSITGLPNRELFLDRLGVAILRAKTETTIRPTVIFIDIDKFKSVNNTFGLLVGDSLLLTTARRLQRHLGPHDTLARVGGDQFALLVVAEQAPSDLASLAERVRRSLRSPIRIAQQEIVLTGSLGIAVFDGEELSHTDLLKEAEMAMYRAKRGGADRIEIFRPEMRGERDDRVQIESDLRKALERGEIRVLYQPIVYLPTEELAGFEALVRWEHPEHGMMNPAEFVPVAEESDLIVKLGSYVLMRAAREVVRWQKELPRSEQPLFVSVNVSSRQLFRQDLIQEIRHILGRAVVPKGSLRLEVTESLVMENPERATEMLELLRAAGAELALDDFGTGYSSLAYLQRFPFDTIKIDRAIVQSSGSGDSAGAAIVRSMVALGHELGKKLVAEGVEEQQDVAFLRSLGCEYAQGFYYGEAMPEREVVNLLRIISKSERKLKARGFFRTTAKRRSARKEAVVAEPAPKPPVTAPAGSADPSVPASTPAPAAVAASGAAGAAEARPLPNRTLRSRHRQQPVAEPPPVATPRIANGKGAPAVVGAHGTGNGRAPASTQPPPRSAHAQRGAASSPPAARPAVAPVGAPGPLDELAKAAGATAGRPASPTPPPARGVTMGPPPMPPARAAGATTTPPPPPVPHAPPRAPAPAPTNDAVDTRSDATGATGAVSPDVRRTSPQTGAPRTGDLSTLPPDIQQSLARLAGRSR